MTDDFEIYTGPVANLKESPWLDSKLFEPGKPVKLTVEHVRVRKNVKGKNGKNNPRVSFLKFAGRDKELWLNTTNRNTMAAMFGPNTANWQGKEIMLVRVDDAKNPEGPGTTSGLRIRPVA